MNLVFILSPRAQEYGTFLRDTGLETKTFADGKEVIEAVKKDEPKVLVVDISLLSFDWIRLVKQVKSLEIAARTIIICNRKSFKLAYEALRLGAADLLEEPITRERFCRVVLRALKERRKTDKLTYSFNYTVTDNFSGFTGRSPLMQNLYAEIDTAADTNVPVFITGESGTGKELCAEALHKRSARADKPFVVLNCSAIPKDLMESELFGHVKGSFTGAVNNRDGAALSADKGTLFLDEICDLPLELQAKLLRFVQTMRFHQVGSDKEKEVDVRIISASNKNPWDEVLKGNFREDLYYRLYVFGIFMPPLRERGEDIILIAERFLREYARQEGKAFSGFSAAAREFLLTYAWRGNVRQLQNAVLSTVISEKGKTISGAMLKKFARNPFLNCEDVHEDKDRIIPLREVEKKAIENALKRCEGNMAKAARALEISPSTLYRKRHAHITEHGKEPQY